MGVLSVARRKISFSAVGRGRVGDVGAEDDSSIGSSVGGRSKAPGGGAVLLEATGWTIELGGMIVLGPASASARASAVRASPMLLVDRGGGDAERRRGCVRRGGRFGGGAERRA